MTGSTSGLRKIYNYAALLALVHVGASLLVLTYAAVTGGLTSSKLQAMVAALQAKPATEIDAEKSASAEKSTSAERPDSKDPHKSDAASAPAMMKKSDHDASFAALQTDLDIIRLESERVKAELDQRLALNNSILLKVASEREAFQRERQAVVDREKAGKPDDRGEGFAKQVAIFENLTPKVAIEHLLAMTDPDDAARVLITLEPRKAKAIIEAAKREDQSTKMKDILRRVRAVTPEAASGKNATAEGQK